MDKLREQFEAWAVRQNWYGSPYHQEIAAAAYQAGAESRPKPFKGSILKHDTPCQDCDSLCFVSMGPQEIVCYHCWLAALHNDALLRIAELEAGSESGKWVRDACFHDMKRLIEIVLADTGKSVSGKMALSSLLDAINFSGPEGFGVQDQKGETR